MKHIILLSDFTELRPKTVVTPVSFASSCNRISTLKISANVASNYKEKCFISNLFSFRIKLQLIRKQLLYLGKRNRSKCKLTFGVFRLQKKIIANGKISNVKIFTTNPMSCVAFFVKLYKTDCAKQPIAANTISIPKLKMN